MSLISGQDVAVGHGWVPGFGVRCVHSFPSFSSPGLSGVPFPSPLPPSLISE